MNVAILHFHLRRGGVTSVMVKQAEALAATDDPPRVVFLSGTAAEVPLSVPVVVIPGLAYDESPSPRADLVAGATALARAILGALNQVFSEGCDVLHVHNPTLCKNSRLLGALGWLQTQGLKLLLQLHDLAEDFRPLVYEGYWPYLERCVYATINTRDRNHLIAAGLGKDQVVLLPNPVGDAASLSSPNDPQGGPAPRTTALYPVRAIGRKNVGEALVLSLFLPGGTDLAVTLPPTSPGDLEAYRLWQSLSQVHGLPVRFEAGLHSSLDELYRSSFCAVTTSVKEGFGYSYLDPLVRGIPVVGRKIPHLVDDFAHQGVIFPKLYDAIWVPQGEVSHSQLAGVVATRLDAFRAHYGVILQGRDFERFENVLTGLKQRYSGDFLDFGSLDGSNQASILGRMRQDLGFRGEMGRLNPWLSSLFQETHNPEESARARASVLAGYSETEYGKELASSYQWALADHEEGSIDRVGLLELFLKPKDFFLVAS